MPYPRMTGLLTIGVCVALALFAGAVTDLVTFTTFSAGEFIQLLAPLFLAALFIERMLEVFLSGSREPESARLQNALKEVKAAVAAADAPVAKQNLLGDQAVREQELAAYKATSKRLAWVGGSLLGVIVAALGVRALGLFVDASEFADLREGQRVWFARVDILLSGGVLAGGSDGIHQIVKRFLEFLKTPE